MRERKYLLWIALATFFLIVFNLPYGVSKGLRGCFREGIASYQGGVMGVVDRFRRMSGAIGNLTELTGDRDRLLHENAALRAETKAAERLVRENNELRALLGFQKREPLHTVACQVVARDDGYGWWETLRLDKGFRDGIRENQPVITPDGLVGKTIEVSGQTCDVLLISDRSFKVAVRFDQDGSFGILHGGGVSVKGVHRLGVVCTPALLQADYIRRDAGIKLGETAMTSGLGGVFPAGLVVGRVEQLAADETGLFQVASVSPAADLGRLTHVLVVTGDR